jgi:hypothetical protein
MSSTTDQNLTCDIILVVGEDQVRISASSLLLCWERDTTTSRQAFYYRADVQHHSLQDPRDLSYSGSN